MPDNTKVPTENEQELLRRANQFDQTALEVIFDSFYDPVYRYIYQHIRHTQTAEDLTSDVFRTLIENLNTKNGPNKFLKAWLYRVAQNLIIDEVRRNKYRDADPISDEYQDEKQPVTQKIEQNQDQLILRQAMSQLTGKQESVIYLKYLQGLNNDETAYVLNMTVGTVKALQHRGLNTLRRYLNQSEKFNLLK
jgi:RNA polymerase sigma-70 factor, ECF subfamily